MLTINLLPEAARKTQLSHIEQLHRTPLMWLAAVVMLVLPVTLWIPIRMIRAQLQDLNAKIQVLEPKKLELDRVQMFLQKLRTQETALKAMGKGQGLWAQRLNILSDLTAEGVWFTELAIDDVKGLVVQGSAVGLKGNAPLDSVTKLANDLKTNQQFASAFKRIEIESIKTAQEGDLELAQFTLTCSPQDVAKPSHQ